MILKEILNKVDKRWQKDFLTFINTGEGSDEFLTYLDTNPQGQAAVDLAVTAQAKVFEGLAEEFKRSPEDAQAQPAEAASNSLTQAVKNVTLLPHEQQIEVFQKAVSTFDNEQQKAAKAFAQTVEATLLSH